MHSKVKFATKVGKNSNAGVSMMGTVSLTGLFLLLFGLKTKARSPETLHFCVHLRLSIFKNSEKDSGSR